MYNCDICGREQFKKIRYKGYTLCSKHVQQLRNYGEFLDNIPRTTKDLNDYIIDNKNNVAIFNVYNQRNEKNGEFIIDIEDVDKIKYYKWRKSYGNIVTGNNTKSNPTLYLTHLLLDVPSTDYENKIDHKNGNTFDNRKSNLRICTQGENVCNKHFMSRNKSGIIGVCQDHRPGRKSNWCAEIRHGGKRWHIGAYVTLEEAAYARYIAEKILFKEFRNTNDDELKFEMFSRIEASRKKEIEKYVTEKVQQ